MTKKYEPQHAWVKELGLKGMFAEAADGLVDNVKAILGNSTPSELAFLTTWVGLAFALHEMGITKYLMDSGDWWRRMLSGESIGDAIAGASATIASRQEQARIEVANYHEVMKKYGREV